MALKFLSFMLPTGSPGVGKVLTSDGTGIGTWQDVPASVDSESFAYFMGG